MNECGHIVPRQTDLVGHFYERSYIAECILQEGHKGPHLIKTPDDKYFGWEFDEGCNCEDCLDFTDSDNQCYIYWKVPKEDAEALLKNRE
jgi:hypothetical protein